MKKILWMVILAVSAVCDVYGSSSKDSLVVMFWNLENFFDTKDSGTGESDKEFSSKGKRRWTERKFYAKCDAVSKGIFWIADRYGRMPDLIGLSEIENKYVLTRLLASTALRKHDYAIIHYDSGDRRGIDVSILYRKSSMILESVSVKTPEYEEKKLATRDILHARMCLADSCRMDFIVNHHPSKYGGEEESHGRRVAAMLALKELADSLGMQNIVIMGDFNDTPDAGSFDVLGDGLVNLGLPLHERGEGTIRYEGKWELIDMFMVTRDMKDHVTMEVCRIPFLMTWERKHPGEKPLRTYSGPRYLGGVSDHCPVIMRSYP